MSFDEMPDELNQAYTVYNHEYYLDLFEKARETYDLSYTYMVVPTGEPLHMFYLFDAVRDTRASDGFLNLCDDVYEALERHRCMWEAWETGKSPAGYDYYDNEYGRTYAYYVPLLINGEKMGVIGVEVEIANVNKAILNNSLRQIAMVGAVLVVCVALMLVVIYKNYIAKLSHLQKSVRAYAESKDADITSDIERDATGKDEISVLALQVSAMIMELENYMARLLDTAQALRSTQEKADALNELATKDALTGIRNKTAYDNEVRHLEWKMSSEEGFQFGIAMVDLNFLKRLNDTFGHEQGNIAIQKLCYIICHTFEHSPVFRIGGDEFVVILENNDFANRDVLTAAFNQKLEALAADESLEPWERVSASIGIAVYDSSIDSSVANVFKRADKAMYQRKKEMKAVREN